MVARPSSFVSWATDTNFASGPDSGLPTKETPDPSAGVIAQGFLPGSPLAGPRLNWLANKLASWTEYLAAIIDANEEHTYQVAKDRYISVPGFAFASGRKKVVAGVSADATLDEGWRPYETVLAGAGPGGRDLIQLQAQAQCAAPFVYGILDLGPYLRTGMVLKEITFHIDPGTANATADNRMQMGVYGINPSGGGVTALETDITDDGTNASQARVQVISPTITVNRVPNAYFAMVRSSSTAAGGAIDRIAGLVLRVDDPGPRNG